MKPEPESVIIKHTIQSLCLLVGKGQAPIIKHQEDKIPWFDQPACGLFLICFKIIFIKLFYFYILSSMWKVCRGGNRTAGW